MAQKQARRGIGAIPMSGWRLRPEFADFDAEKRFNVAAIQTKSDLAVSAGALHATFPASSTAVGHRSRR